MHRAPTPLLAFLLSVSLTACDDSGSSSGEQGDSETLAGNSASEDETTKPGSVGAGTETNEGPPDETKADPNSTGPSSPGPDDAPNTSGPNTDGSNTQDPNPDDSDTAEPNPNPSSPAEDTSAPAASDTQSAPGSSAGTVPHESAVEAPAEAVSPFIVVDQFGYLPDSEKIAVLRDPELGFDADGQYAPGASYQLIDASTGDVALELSAAAWNGGAVHEQSGDHAWWLDFSSFTTPGVYYVLDVDAAVRSDLFRIADDVYADVLRHALRTFYYQRAGFAKTAEFAGEGWADGASHVGPGQDKNARRFDATDDASTERDLSGAWYDAGDYNRYTPWTADYVVVLLRMFEERPQVFGDDLGIPESNNGTPDILDEVKFGLEQLVRTQSAAGGCISVLGVGSGSPPSSVTDPSVYGPETTNATIRVGTAFAWAAHTFAERDPEFASQMLDRAQLAWQFAEANPELVFNNSGQVAAGEQQSSPEEVGLYQLGFAVSLYRAGADDVYKDYFEANYADAGLQLLGGYNAAWQLQFTEFYLDYARLADADAAISAAIVSAFSDTIMSGDNLGNLEAEQDPYLAHVADYTWGSNAHKSRTGCLQYDVIAFETNSEQAASARIAAERYVHYLHGVNPLGLVYLSNMGSVGANTSVTSFFHSWFVDGSELWDEVGLSTYGPAPGFLAGGPNPSYDWDGVCPGQELCPASRPTPPYAQPTQKSFANFNTGWPVNSWSVTENSNGYQVYYLRLLSKFVR